MKTFEIQNTKDTRSGFGEGLHELGKKNERVVALCADLIGSLKMDAFIKDYPNRFFQMGIAVPKGGTPSLAISSLNSFTASSIPSAALTLSLACL